VKALDQPPTLGTEASRNSPRLSRANQVAEALVLAALFATPALVCMHMAMVTDADVWWHMRTGQWILEHHSIPHTDPFTSFAAGKPWQPYSWLFELIVLKCFQWFDLAGIVGYTTAMVLAITIALWHLIKRLQQDFSVNALLTVLAGLSLMRLFTPRPWLFTVLFFALQLDILMHARRTGKTRELLWLPLLYALWANIHIQFIDGLIILALALAESILARRWPPAQTRSNPAWLGGVFAACVLATLANPFGWHIYPIAHEMATHSGIKYVSEMHALSFRTWTDFCLLFLALAAAAALAWRTSRASRDVSTNRIPLPLFETGLLAFAAIVSFRSGRDMWVMIIAASAILAQSLGDIEGKRRPTAFFTIPVMVVAIAVLLSLGSRAMHVDNAHLQTQLVERLPVRAVQAVKKHAYAGPLFNDFDWGGYLIWDLRMPVSIDGRTALDGDKRLDRSFATWNGNPDWSSDPDLQAAGLVIGPVTAPLTQLLRMDPQFQLAYEDKLAAVFIARRLGEQP
jgi:hypothetical protein